MRRSTALLALFAAASVSLAFATTAASRSIDPAAATAADLDDATIVAILDATNTADVESGRLAMERGQSPEVREFGAMLARDHAQVRDMGRDLARRLGVTPTPPADSSSAVAHRKAMAQLRATPAAGFDHAFLRHEVAFHKAAIDAVTTTILPAIRNEELKALVVKVAPAFQAHMLAADNLDKKLAGAAGQ